MTSRQHLFGCRRRLIDDWAAYLAGKRSQLEPMRV